MNKLEQQLKENCERNKTQLLQLNKEYELAKLGRDMSDEQSKDIYNKVLAENTFYVSEDCPRMGVKAGDRIMDDDCSFLMSDTDFDRFSALCNKEFYAAGITTEDGTYITNWDMIFIKAKQALVYSLIDFIIPSPLREQFEQVKTSIVYQDKLLAAFSGCLR